MLVLMLEVQKGCNGDIDTCIQDKFSYPTIHLSKHLWHNLQTKGVQITEDALYWVEKIVFFFEICNAYGTKRFHKFALAWVGNRSQYS